MESDAATGREKAKKESGAKDRAEKAKDRIHSQRSSLESGSRFPWCVFAQSSFFALVLSLLRGALMLCSLLPRRQHIQDRCRPTSRSVSCNLRFGFSGLFSEAMGFLLNFPSRFRLIAALLMLLRLLLGTALQECDALLTTRRSTGLNCCLSNPKRYSQSLHFSSAGENIADEATSSLGKLSFDF